jgi:hypothetical protein
MADWKTITIGARTQYVVKVSAVDYDFLIQWRWTYAVSHKHGGLVYARRSIRSGGANVTILMHRVVIERMGLVRPSDRHFVDHENGDSLDNRRANDQGLQQLQWLTTAENNAKKRGVRAVPIVPRRGGPLPEIPFEL